MLYVKQKIVARFLLLLLSLLSFNVFSENQEENGENHNVLYLNSYAISFSWSDSVIVGVLDIFNQHSDIMLFNENLDAKRFGEVHFEQQYRFIKAKYRGIKFSAVVVSDNDGLDFIMQYGDDLFPKVPVVFCGVSDGEDYPIENRNCYGIHEMVEPDTLVQMVLTLMPNAKHLYFFSDSTTTSLLNLKRIQSIEEVYKNKVNFEYISNIAIDSILKLVANLKEESAIALIDIYSDLAKNPINTDVLVRKMAKVSTAPIFIDRETVFGKGTAGGIVISGSDQGRAAAELALRFIREPGFVPKNKIASLEKHYSFDYHVLQKYDISPALVPKGSKLINAPSSFVADNLQYIIAVLLVIISLLLIIAVLYVNIIRRKRAERLVVKKLHEIEQNNEELETMNHNVKEVNVELEVTNETLKETNDDLELALSKAEESERLKTTFLANISHEIRTPLNAIVGFSDLLDEPLIERVVKDGYINTIKASSQQLLHIIEGIVELSKIEAKKIVLLETEGSLIDMFALIHAKMELLLPDAILLRMERDPQIEQKPWVIADFKKLKDILTKLITNAIKYSSVGEVTYGCAVKESGLLEFFVKDQGIGIDKKYHKVVFEKFRQVDSSNNFFQSGSGVGLSIAKSYVDLMKGDIWIESKLGKGTKVCFTIPYKPN